jgi:uncharacterized membrane protein YeaQ/YmgE (transglycosylase-associated protein family)
MAGGAPHPQSIYETAGSHQANLGAGTAAFWSFLVVLVATAPVYAWLYNGAGKATFTPVLAHGLGNVIGETTVDASPWTSAIVTCAAGAVALLWMWRLVRRRGNGSRHVPDPVKRASG